MGKVQLPTLPPWMQQTSRVQAWGWAEPRALAGPGCRHSRQDPAGRQGPALTSVLCLGHGQGLCLCVCLGVYICLCVHTCLCMHTCAHVHASTCMYICGHVHLCGHMCVCMHVHLRAHVSVCMCLWTRVCIYACVCVYVCLCVSVHVSVCAHVCGNRGPVMGSEPGGLPLPPSGRLCPAVCGAGGVWCQPH